jgi:Flp pilus assembly protein TadD/TM2 domain-containing membrane protein YozV
MTMRRMALAASLVAASSVAAQTQSGAPRESLKQSTLTAPPAPACTSVIRTGTPTAEQRRSARQLAQRGQEAAILGDATTALSQFRQAVALDPSDPDLAYQLARAYESAGASADAASEYCRFLALAPNAPEANEARDRARTLAPQRPDPSYVAASSAFKLGLTAYERGQLVEADAHFTTAIANHSTWAEAYYDRAVVRAANGDRYGSVDDFNHYLQLRPEAPDRLDVVARMESLRQPVLSPGQALSLGLVIPGGGQFYARRPVRGVLSLVGVLGSIGAALYQKTNVTSRDTVYTDPFGRHYNGVVKHSEQQRPYVVPGVLAATGILFFSAFDAFKYTQELSAGQRRVSVSLAPVGGAVVARISVR